MAKKTFTTEELQSALKNIGIAPGDTILMHSSLFQLGKLENVDADNAPLAVADAILEYLGPEGKLCVPVFSWEFYRGNEYSVDDTPAEPDMGALNEALRQRSDAYRTRHPGQSFACVGKWAEHLGSAQFDTESTWAKGGVVEFMEKQNAKTVMLGPPGWGSCSIIHYVEENLNVPYRFWKTFTGKYKPVGGTSFEERTCNFFARQFEPFEWDTCMDPVGDLLEDSGLLKSASVGRGSVSAFVWSEMFEVLTKKLQADPYWLVHPVIPDAKDAENDEDSKSLTLSIPAAVLKSWVSEMSEEDLEAIGVVKSTENKFSGDAVAGRLVGVLEQLLSPDFIASLTEESNLISGGIDSTSFLQMLEMLQNEFDEDISEHADSLNSLTIFGSLLEACKSAVGDEDEDDSSVISYPEVLNLTPEELGNGQNLRIALLGVGKPLLSVMEGLSSGNASEKVTVVQVFTNTNDMAAVTLAESMGASVKSHKGMHKGNTDQTAAELASLNVDMLFSVNNVKYVRQKILDCFPKGSFNLHPGKLPEYGGLHVAQWAIRNAGACACVLSVFVPSYLCLLPHSKTCITLIVCTKRLLVKQHFTG